MEKVYYPGTVQGNTPVTAKGLAVTITVTSGVASIAAAATGVGDGILEDPGGVDGATPVAGDPCSVVVFGPTKGYSSATVTRAMNVTADASGGQLEQTANSSEKAVGTAITDSPSGGGYFDILVGVRMGHDAS